MDASTVLHRQAGDITWPEISEWPVPIGAGRHYGVPLGVGGALIPVPSVTTVLSATEETLWLERWRRNASPERLAEVDAKMVRNRDDGTWLHGVIEAFFGTGEIPDLAGQSERRAALWASIFPGLEALDAAEVYIEKAIYHPAGYAGRFDMLTRESSGRWMLLDWKNSDESIKKKGKLAKYRCQLGAYAAGIECVTGGRIIVDNAAVVVAIPGQSAEAHYMSSEVLRGESENFLWRAKQYQEGEIL